MDPLAAFQATLLQGPEPPPLSVAELREKEAGLIAAAGDPAAPLADAQNRFEHAAALAEDPDRDEGERANSLHVARRSVQEIEARLRAHRAGQVCAELMGSAAAYADGNDLALRRTIQMERDMRDKLKNEVRSREDEMYKALALLEGKYARIRREARGTVVSLPDILFDFNQATLKREVEFSLVRLATILDQFPEMSMAIEGHTDSIGTQEYNMELSERRARAVFEFLSSQGVSAGRFTVAGFGMTRPVADNATVEGRARNRRVDVVIRGGE
jgi:outer membrane protein OmpA-like peptidoglycan-associated protein